MESMRFCKDLKITQSIKHSRKDARDTYVMSVLC
jgi:hypothetical protein